MNILALYLKEVDYKKVGKKKVEVKRVNFTDKRIVKVLRSLGHSVDWMEYSKERLSSVKDGYDLIFNLADGLENDNDFQEIPILRQIEKLDIPYTGNSSKVIKDCYDKSNIKRTLIKKGIKTPKFQVIKNKKQKLDSSLRFPLILKPLFTDGGVGITDDSVVYNEIKFKRQLKKCLKEHAQPVLVEEYIDGRDFCVPVVGGRAFPAVECTFSKRVFKNRPKIMTYDVKWATGTKDYNLTYFNIRNKIQRNFSFELKKSITKTAEKAFKAMGCTAYASVDIRARGNEIFVIEINPNCWIDKFSDSAKSAKSIGVSYNKFIEKIVKLSRTQEK
ncbi:ATP-grasp domain-containing protein [Candidatus Woesearchaeota archaeon]|nr:ATP-grasp domain-containing protein [Candidatus Woesearchaeota archaeon]